MIKAAKVVKTAVSKVSSKFSSGSKKVNNSTPKTNLNSTHSSSQVAKGKTPGK